MKKIQFNAGMFEGKADWFEIESFDTDAEAMAFLKGKGFPNHYRIAPEAEAEFSAEAEAEFSAEMQWLEATGAGIR